MRVERVYGGDAIVVDHMQLRADLLGDLDSRLGGRGRLLRAVGANRTLVGKMLIVYASSLDAFPSGWMMPAAEALRISTD
jgi:hypothetical protein